MLKVKDPAMRDYLKNSLMLSGGVALANGIYNYLSKDYTLTQSFAMNVPEAVMFGFSTTALTGWFEKMELPPYLSPLASLPVSLMLCKPMAVQAMHEFHRQNLHEALTKSEAEFGNKPDRMDFNEARKAFAKPATP